LRRLPRQAPHRPGPNLRRNPRRTPHRIPPLPRPRPPPEVTTNDPELLTQEDLRSAYERNAGSEGNADCIAGRVWREDLDACHIGIKKLNRHEGVAGLV